VLLCHFYKSDMKKSKAPFTDKGHIVNCDFYKNRKPSPMERDNKAIKELSQRIGVSETQISNRLKLLDEPEFFRKKAKENLKLSQGQGGILLPLNSKEASIDTMKEVSKLAGVG